MRNNNYGRHHARGYGSYDYDSSHYTPARPLNVIERGRIGIEPSSRSISRGIDSLGSRHTSRSNSIRSDANLRYHPYMHPQMVEPEELLNMENRRSLSQSQRAYSRRSSRSHSRSSLQDLMLGKRVAMQIADDPPTRYMKPRTLSAQRSIPIPMSQEEHFRRGDRYNDRPSYQRSGSVRGGGHSSQDHRRDYSEDEYYREQAHRSYRRHNIHHSDQRRSSVGSRNSSRHSEQPNNNWKVSDNRTMRDNINLLRHSSKGELLGQGEQLDSEPDPALTSNLNNTMIPVAIHREVTHAFATQDRLVLRSLESTCQPNRDWSEELTRAAREIALISRLRPYQIGMANILMEGRDAVFSVMPGQGRSLGYILPGILKKGFSIIIQPKLLPGSRRLNRFERLKIPHLAAHDELTTQEIDGINSKLTSMLVNRKCNIKFLVCSPKILHQKVETETLSILKEFHRLKVIQRIFILDFDSADTYGSGCLANLDFRKHFPGLQIALQSADPLPCLKNTGIGLFLRRVFPNFMTEQSHDYNSKEVSVLDGGAHSTFSNPTYQSVTSENPRWLMLPHNLVAGVLAPYTHFSVVTNSSPLATSSNHLTILQNLVTQPPLQGVPGTIVCQNPYIAERIKVWAAGQRLANLIKVVLSAASLPLDPKASAVTAPAKPKATGPPTSAVGIQTGGYSEEIVDPKETHQLGGAWGNTAHGLKEDIEDVDFDELDMTGANKRNKTANRWVVHWGTCCSSREYLKDVNRYACPEELQLVTYCVYVVNPGQTKDASFKESVISKLHNGEDRLEAFKFGLGQFQRYLEDRVTCRRTLLAHSQLQVASMERCGSLCDNCKVASISPPRIVDCMEVFHKVMFYFELAQQAIVNPQLTLSKLRDILLARADGDYVIKKSASALNGILKTVDDDNIVAVFLTSLVRNKYLQEKPLAGVLADSNYLTVDPSVLAVLNPVFKAKRIPGRRLCATYIVSFPGKKSFLPKLPSESTAMNSVGAKLSAVVAGVREIKAREALKRLSITWDVEAPVSAAPTKPMLRSRLHRSKIVEENDDIGEGEDYLHQEGPYQNWRRKNAPRGMDGHRDIYRVGHAGIPALEYQDIKEGITNYQIETSTVNRIPSDPLSNTDLGYCVDPETFEDILCRLETLCDFISSRNPDEVKMIGDSEMFELVRNLPTNRNELALLKPRLGPHVMLIPDVILKEITHFVSIYGIHKGTLEEQALRIKTMSPRKPNSVLRAQVERELGADVEQNIKIYSQSVASCVAGGWAWMNPHVVEELLLGLVPKSIQTQLSEINNDQNEAFYLIYLRSKPRNATIEPKRRRQLIENFKNTRNPSKNKSSEREAKRTLRSKLPTRKVGTNRDDSSRKSQEPPSKENSKIVAEQTTENKNGTQKQIDDAAPIFSFGSQLDECWLGLGTINLPEQPLPEPKSEPKPKNMQSQIKSPPLNFEGDNKFLQTQPKLEDNPFSTMNLEEFFSDNLFDKGSSTLHKPRLPLESEVTGSKQNNAKVSMSKKSAIKASKIPSAERLSNSENRQAAAKKEAFVQLVYNDATMQMEEQKVKIEEEGEIPVLKQLNVVAKSKTETPIKPKPESEPTHRQARHPSSKSKANVIDVPNKFDSGRRGSPVYNKSPSMKQPASLFNSPNMIALMETGVRADPMNQTKLTARDQIPTQNCLNRPQPPMLAKGPLQDASSQGMFEVQANESIGLQSGKKQDEGDLNRHAELRAVSKLAGKGKIVTKPTSKMRSPDGQSSHSDTSTTLSVLSKQPEPKVADSRLTQDHAADEAASQNKVPLLFGVGGPSPVLSPTASTPGDTPRPGKPTLQHLPAILQGDLLGALPETKDELQLQRASKEKSPRARGEEQREQEAAALQKQKSTPKKRAGRKQHKDASEGSEKSDFHQEFSLSGQLGVGTEPSLSTTNIFPGLSDFSFFNHDADFSLD